MILIDNRDELIKNLDTVESYLNGDNDEVVEIMAELIRKGKNFVAYNFNGSTHFAPSRFVGYKDNTIRKHFQKDNGKHGTYTSQRLRRSDILGIDRPDPELQTEWESYCRECGVEPTKGTKTFWRLSDYEAKVKGTILVILHMKGIIRQYNRQRKIISISMEVSAKFVDLIFMRLMARLVAII